MIKRIIIFMISIIDRIKWFFQFATLSFFEKKKNYKLLEYKGPVLIFVPHADDELIGCYNLIAKRKEEIILLYFELTGTNKDLDNKQKRYDEFKMFCEKNNVQFYCFKSKFQIVELIKNKRIKNIFFPSPVDWHPEHRIMSNYIIDIVNSDCPSLSLFLYHITVPIVSLCAVGIIENHNDIKMKKAVFNTIYISQKHVPICRAAYHERLNGRFYNSYGAEVYLPVTLVELVRLISYINNNLEKINNLSKYINSIGKVRLISEGIYKDVFEYEK